MTDTFEMKPGDRKRAIKFKTSDYKAGGKFAGATVNFRMKDASGGVVVDGVGSVLDNNGIIGYAWGAGETDTVGSYRGEFVVTFSDGLEDTYPSFGFIPVRINQEV
jgi:hypothetical protein